MIADYLDFEAQPWKPVAVEVAIVWAVVYAAFMAYAATNTTGFLFIDNANLVVHEGGHLLFGWFGQTMSLWGGTILQWLVPALLATYFLCQRQTTAFVFSSFLLFENFLYTATYMADARAQQLALVTVGDPDVAGHDWNTIFSSLGVLPYDTRIAALVRLLGWVGMIGSVSWLLWRAYIDRVERKGSAFV